MSLDIQKLPSHSSVDEKSRRLSVLALAIGSFAIGTAEFVSMGLEPEMAQTSGVNIATAGQYISAYAIGVVIGAPILAVATAKLPRKYVLIALMLFYALANIATSFVASYQSLILLRFISGLPHGIYFGVAAIAASSMVEMKDRPKAVGSVMLGLTIATVIGAPGGTWVGQLFGWQVTFILVGIIALACCFMIWKYLPFVPTALGVSPLTELVALKQKQVWFMLATVATGFAGLFAVFTYIKPILMNVSGIPLTWVPIVMPLFGIGMVVGNIYGPKIAVKIGTMKMIFWSMLWSSSIFFLFFFFAHHSLTAALGCFLVGTSFACIPSIQTRIMDVAKDAQTLAGSLIQSAFNVANAMGAAAGGVVLMAGFSYEYTAILGGVLALVGFGIFWTSWRLDKRDEQLQRNEIA